MQYDDYIEGDWIDSNKATNKVRYKKVWWGHCFTAEENNKLLNGEYISFQHDSRIITGHLQYCKNKEGKTYFGFYPKGWKDFEANPVFVSIQDSNYPIDRKKEAWINQFMRLYYYSKLINADGSKVKADFITDKDRQEQGIDVILYVNNKKYIIDEKAQTDYAERKEGPLNTFALELLNGSSGNPGWFVNDSLKTEYYMFIWPHSDTRFTDVNSIEYVKYALVERERLKAVIYRRFQSTEILKSYASKLYNHKLTGTDERFNKIYYKKNPFTDNAYLVYTQKPTDEQEGKVEKPINLVINKETIDAIAITKGTLFRKNQHNGGIL